jgi:hypothetical protein
MTQAEKKLNKIDVELKDYMIHAEQKCRKIRNDRIPFSPEAGKWIRRLQIYGTLLQRQRGQRCNLGNLRQAALRGGINNPFELSEHEILLRITVIFTKNTDSSIELTTSDGARKKPRSLGGRTPQCKYYK